MLPGYSPLVTIAQNHIHLGVWNGSGMTAYNEPPYKFFHVLRITPHFTAMATVKRSWTGAGSLHVVSDGSGNPIVYKEFEIQLRIAKTQLPLLAALQWRDLWYVDELHCPDFFDHTPFLRHMVMTDLKQDDDLTPDRANPLVTLQLTDMDTVPSL